MKFTVSYKFNKADKFTCSTGTSTKKADAEKLAKKLASYGLTRVKVVEL